MCLAVYLAASSWLPAIPFIEGTSDFHVSDLKEHEEAVRSQLTAPNVVYVGAFTGCGCGFDPEGEDPSGPYEERGKRSLRELVDYINEHVNGGPAELYISWEGEWNLPALRRIELNASELAERTDWLEERTHVALVAS
jgi:hypothetical protein